MRNDKSKPMKWQEFKTAHNFRIAEKCCANCKHGAEGYESECDCENPLIDEEDRWRAGGEINNVCDLWEAEGGAACTSPR